MDSVAGEFALRLADPGTGQAVLSSSSVSVGTVDRLDVSCWKPHTEDRT